MCCVTHCPCLVHAVTEMLVNVLNIHGEDDDDDDPSENGCEGVVRVRVRMGVGGEVSRVTCWA